MRFHVHEVVGINRISWENLQKPDDIYGGEDGVATAIAEYGQPVDYHSGL